MIGLKKYFWRKLGNCILRINAPYKIYLIVLIFPILVSCSKSPEAMFTVSKPVLLEKQFFSFSNISAGAENYKWEFGDGTSSTDKNPVKSYQSKGKYIVKLTAYGKNPNKSSVCYQTVTIKENPNKFSGVLNGKGFDYFEGINYYVPDYPDIWNSEYSDFRASSYLVIYSLRGQAMLSLSSAINYKSSNAITIQHFKDLYTGYKPFATDSLDKLSNRTDGVFLTFRDSDNMFWSTDYGSQNQIGSSIFFEILDSQDWVDEFGQHSKIKVKAVFNCKLYSEDNRSGYASGIYYFERSIQIS